MRVYEPGHKDLTKEEKKELDDMTWELYQQYPKEKRNRKFEDILYIMVGEYLKKINFYERNCVEK